MVVLDEANVIERKELGCGGGVMSSLQAAAFPNWRSELPQGGTKETFNTS